MTANQINTVAAIVVSALCACGITIVYILHLTKKLSLGHQQEDFAKERLYTDMVDALEALVEKYAIHNVAHGFWSTGGNVELESAVAVLARVGVVKVIEAHGHGMTYFAWHETGVPE